MDKKINYELNKKKSNKNNGKDNFFYFFYFINHTDLYHDFRSGFKNSATEKYFNELGIKRFKFKKGISSEQKKSVITYTLSTIYSLTTLIKIDPQLFGQKTLIIEISDKYSPHNIYYSYKKTFKIIFLHNSKNYAQPIGGALIHEWAHFVDNQLFLSFKNELNITWGRHISDFLWRFSKDKKVLFDYLDIIKINQIDHIKIFFRNLFNILFFLNSKLVPLIHQRTSKKAFYRKTPITNFINPCELFAYSFEQYIYFKIRKQNNLLGKIGPLFDFSNGKTKGNPMEISEHDLIKLTPYFDRFIRLLPVIIKSRKYFNGLSNPNC